MDLQWKLFWTFIATAVLCKFLAPNSVQEDYPRAFATFAVIAVFSVIGAFVCVIAGIWA